MSGVSLAVDVGVGQSGPVGLVIVLALAVAAVFLYRSMNKHIQRIPESFDEPGPDEGPDSAGSADPAGTGETSEPEAGERGDPDRDT